MGDRVWRNACALAASVDKMTGPRAKCFLDRRVWVTAIRFAMSIAVNCAGCGRPYNLNERFAGLTVKCKQCGGAIAVPALHAAAAAPDSAWLVNEADQLRAAASQAPWQQAPLAKLPGGSYKPKKTAGIGRWIAGAASTGLVIVLAVSSAYLRYVRRVQRRERAEQQQVDRVANTAPAPAAGPIVPAVLDQARPGAPPLPSGSGQTVVVFVHDLPEGTGKAVTDRLRKWSGAANMRSDSRGDRPGEATITLSPVADLRALADKVSRRHSRRS